VIALKYGYAGEIVEIDLSTKKIVKKNTDRQMVKKFIGGLGFSSKMLFEQVGKDVSPYAPDNIVVVAPGALTGTGAPTACRTEISTKSPLTGTIGTGNFGGSWGTRLKKAGYDALVVEGTSRKPVYVRIDDSFIAVESAEHLLGRDCWETTDALTRELGEDFSLMAIGQAGQNLVRFACPVIDYHHAAGRSHAGCVMGAKRLKAIAVRGTGAIAIAARERLEKITKEIVERIWDYPDKESVLHNIHHFTRDHARLGHLGCLNYQTTILPSDSEIFDIAAFRDNIRTGFEYGYHCPLEPYYGCNIVADVKRGKFSGLRLPGVVFTLPYTYYGAKCGIKSVAAMWKIRELCQRYGMDESGPIPFALELFQRGIITKKDTYGLELKWGNEDAIMELLKQIALREGFGKILAEGSSRAAEMIGHGAREYAMVIKNMEIQTTVDPRVLPMSTCLGHLTCVRGADDLKSTHTVAEVLPRWAEESAMSKEDYVAWLYKRLDMPASIKKKLLGTPHRSSVPAKSKAYMTKLYEDISCVFNSLGICLFAVNKYSIIGLNYLAKLYNACTGWRILPRELYLAGERTLNLTKAYATRQGMTRKDDDWPSRFYKEPIADGPMKGSILSRQKIDQLLDEYYSIRGWNKRNGTPTRDRLRFLGLNEVADELVRLGLV
jgi:aldehyde:ferredoxin oxidoreductase